jgi:hypothetical protein
MEITGIVAWEYYNLMQKHYQLFFTAIFNFFEKQTRPLPAGNYLR